MKCWITNKATDLNHFFVSRQTFNEDLTHWDTSSATSMDKMFWACFVFNINLNQQNVGKVAIMSHMFYCAKSLNEKFYWDVSGVSSAGRMFGGSPRIIGCD